MITIKIDGIDAVKRALAQNAKQARYAAAVALTRTAKKAEEETYAEFRRVFDRPTRTTMKSLRTKTAKKSDLTAMVYMKDNPLGGKNALGMSEILGHHFTGGARAQKKLEYILQANNYIKQGQRVVPGKAAKLDSHGNMSKGQIVQILSQLLVKGSGYDSTPTKSKRSKRNVAKAGTIFWSYGPNGKNTPLVDKTTGITYGYSGGVASRLKAGAWVKVGTTVKPLLIVVSGTRYKQRVNLETIANKTMSGFDAEFTRTFKHAMRTAR